LGQTNRSPKRAGHGCAVLPVHSRTTQRELVGGPECGNGGPPCRKRGVVTPFGDKRNHKGWGGIICYCFNNQLQQRNEVAARKVKDQFTTNRPSPEPCRVAKRTAKRAQ